MTTRTLQILLALAEGPAHGYGVKQRVERRTNGTVELRSGTLYEAIQRLEGQRAIKEVPPPKGEVPSGGPPKRYYALTEEGYHALAQEISRMDAVVRHAKSLPFLSTERA